jgi:hypothetical protein
MTGELYIRPSCSACGAGKEPRSGGVCEAYGCSVNSAALGSSMPSGLRGVFVLECAER